MGLPVLHTQATRLDDVARLLRLIGQASGHAVAGETAAQAYSTRLAALQPRNAFLHTAAVDLQLGFTRTP